jgi:iron complex outermembrane receptor protein
MSGMIRAESKQNHKTSHSVFKLTPIAAFIASITLGASGLAQGQEQKTVDELKAENARLKELLDENQKKIDNAEKLAGVASSSEAQKKPAEDTKLGRVVVRARSRLEAVHDVPQSSSVVTGAELNRELALDLGAITRRSASIQFNQNNTRGGSLSIRGLGRRAFTETQDPSVGLVVDGVPYALTELGNFDFYDVDSVNVLRGPRGTEGGLAASAGTVYIDTKRPSFTPSSDFQLVYGERDTVIAKASTGGTVIDDLLAWRGSFIADHGRGYYESGYDKNYSFYDHNRLAGRAQFLLTPNEDLSARLSVDLQPKAPQVENGLTLHHDQPYLFENGKLTDPSGTSVRAKLDGFTDDKGNHFSGRSLLLNRTYASNRVQNSPYTLADYNGNEYLQNENQGQTVSNKGVSAQIDYYTGHDTLTSITAWHAFTFDAHNDEGTPFDISRNGGGGVYFDQYSQEFRIDSDAGGLVDYRAGVIFLGTEDTIESRTGWGSDAGAWFATNKQYGTLERDASINRGAGIALLSDSLNDLYTYGASYVDTSSSAIYGKLNWHLTDQLNVDTGLRFTHENRSTKDIKELTANGIGAALNPGNVHTASGDVETGGFVSDAVGDLGSNSAAQLALADSVAQKYFGAANYAALTLDQKNQVAAAKALRKGQIGALSDGITSKYSDNLFTALIGPSYKINDNETAYASWQYGEKSGSALNVNFVSANVKPEKTNAFELGLKSYLLDKKLLVNTDIYYMDIRDYQSSVRVVDDFTTATNIANNQANPIAYVTAQGNVKRARAKGFETDVFYSGIPDTTIRLTGAYNDARYIDFENAAFPDELAYLSTPAKPYTDQSGQQLPGVSKWNFNLGAEYRHSVFNDYSFHSSFNTNFYSRFNNTDTLSDYGWIAGGSQTDASIGLTTKNYLDISLISKNLFDNRKHESAWNSYTPYPYPRWLGVSVSGKL